MSKILSKGNSKAKVRLIMDIIERKEKELEYLQKDLDRWKDKLRKEELK